MTTTNEDRRLSTLRRIRVSKRMFCGTVADIIGYFLALTKYAEWTVDNDRAWALLAKQPPGLLGTRIDEISVNPKTFGPWARRHAPELTLSPKQLEYQLWRQHLLFGFSPEDAHSSREQYYAGDDVRDCIYTSLAVLDYKGLSWRSFRRLLRHDLPIKDFLDATGYTRQELAEICEPHEADIIASGLAVFNLDLKGEEGSWHTALMQRVEEDYAHELALDLKEDMKIPQHKGFAFPGAPGVPRETYGGDAADEVDEPLDSDTDEADDEHPLELGDIPGGIRVRGEGSSLPGYLGSEGAIQPPHSPIAGDGEWQRAEVLDGVSSDTRTRQIANNADAETRIAEHTRDSAATFFKEIGLEMLRRRAEQLRTLSALPVDSPEVGFSPRLAGLLKKNHIPDIQVMLAWKMEELRELRGFGQKMEDEVQAFLDQHDLVLGVEG
ncbi:MAG: hypothetical protein WC451_00735 [Patescibacteria group bacterium]